MWPGRGAARWGLESEAEMGDEVRLRDLLVYLAGSLGCCTLTPGRWGGNRDPWEVTASSAGAVVAGSSVAART